MILFPDVEAHTITYLQTALASRSEPYTVGVWVGNLLPLERPPRAVLVRDDGGQTLGDVRAVARLGINVYAATEVDVSDLANLVSALVGGMADGVPVVRASTTRPYSVTDDAGTPHQYFTAELIIRGTNLQP